MPAPSIRIDEPPLRLSRLPRLLRFRAAIFGLLAVVFAGSLLVAAPAGATRIVHRNAEELARLADRIFVGTCLSAQERRRGDLFFTEYVFEVEE
ncbi:MAG TPA: hypothetical protein VMT85_13740, partial [Thermoanaerobaculia bacterium]|nr:hypothetical protein [Thermoanaerobaculia bacterium]